ncbi:MULTISPECIES: hypothetical protein [Cupriavidus]
MTMTAKKLTLNAINTIVRARGIDATLYAAEDYFYFDGPAVEWAYSASVGVFRLNHLSLAQWMNALDEIVKDSNDRRPEGVAEVVPLPAPTPWLGRTVTLRPTQGGDQPRKTARVVAETAKRVQVEMEDGRKRTFAKADGQPGSKLDRAFPCYVMGLPGTDAGKAA